MWDNALSRFASHSAHILRPRPALLWRKNNWANFHLKEAVVKTKIRLGLFYFLLSTLPCSAVPWWLKPNDGHPPPSHLAPLLKVFGCFRSCFRSLWETNEMVFFLSFFPDLSDLLISNCLLFYFPLPFSLSLYFQVFFASLLPPLPPSSILSPQLQGDVWSTSALGSMGCQLF